MVLKSWWRAALCFFWAFDSNYCFSRSLQDIIASKKLFIAVTSKDNPPFYSMNLQDGKLSGFDVELAEQIASALGVELNWLRQSPDFSDLSQLLLSHKADLVISSYHITLDRAKELRFTIPYFKEKRIFLVLRKNDSSIVNQLVQLTYLNKNAKPLRTGMLENSTFASNFSKQYPNCPQIVFSQMDKLINSLKEGTIEIANVSESVINSWLEEHEEDLLYIKKYYIPYDINKLAIAVHPQNEHLLSWLNVFIESALDDGSLKKLSEKYFNASKFKNYEILHAY